MPKSERNWTEWSESTNVMKSLKEHAAVTLLAFALMAFFALIVIAVRPLNPLKETIANFSFTDIYYSILSTGEAQESHLVTIVDINQFRGRRNFAQLLDDIESHHPAAICVDAVFEGPDLADQEGDMLLADVVEHYDNIVFALKMEDIGLDAEGQWVSTSPPIRSYFSDFITPTRQAFCNMPRGNLYDAMKREVPITAIVDDTLCRSLIVETANLYAHRDITNGRTTPVRINYTPTNFPTLTPRQVAARPHDIEDRIVIIGDLHEQNDQHWTPLGTKIAGATILAYGIQTMLTRSEVASPPLAVTIALAFFIVVIMRIILKAHARRTMGSPRLVVKYLLGSDYARSIIIFAYSSLLLMISFLIFVRWNITLSLGWALSSMALLRTAENLYNAIHSYHNALRDKNDNEREVRNENK